MSQPSMQELSHNHIFFTIGSGDMKREGIQKHHCDVIFDITK